MQGLKARERTLKLDMTVSEYIKELVLWDLEDNILDKKELFEKGGNVDNYVNEIRNLRQRTISLTNEVEHYKSQLRGLNDISIELDKYKTLYRQKQQSLEQCANKIVELETALEIIGSKKQRKVTKWEVFGGLNQLVDRLIKLKTVKDDIGSKPRLKEAIINTLDFTETLYDFHYGYHLYMENQRKYYLIKDAYVDDFIEEFELTDEDIDE
jgi:DNA repair exonuclease SbcCD ATPase subunit